MQVQNLLVCLLMKGLNISSQLISTKPPFLLTYLFSLPLGGEILQVMIATWGRVAVRRWWKEMDSLIFLSRCYDSGDELTR